MQIRVCWHMYQLWFTWLHTAHLSIDWAVAVHAIWTWADSCCDLCFASAAVDTWQSHRHVHALDGEEQNTPSRNCQTLQQSGRLHQTVCIRPFASDSTAEGQDIAWVNLGNPVWYLASHKIDAKRCSLFFSFFSILFFASLSNLLV